MPNNKLLQGEELKNYFIKRFNMTEEKAEKEVKRLNNIIKKECK